MGSTLYSEYSNQELLIFTDQTLISTYFILRMAGIPQRKNKQMKCFLGTHPWGLMGPVINACESRASIRPRLGGAPEEAGRVPHLQAFLVSCGSSE